MERAPLSSRFKRSSERLHAPLWRATAYISISSSVPSAFSPVLDFTRIVLEFVDWDNDVRRLSKTAGITVLLCLERSEITTIPLYEPISGGFGIPIKRGKDVGHEPAAGVGYICCISRCTRPPGTHHTWPIVCEKFFEESAYVLSTFTGFSNGRPSLWWCFASVDKCAEDR